MATVQSVNLVKNRKPHFVDIFLSWALSIGRGLVILTEVVALGAFLFRFGLDRQLVDLHDKIVQEQNIVKFLKKNEDTYRNLQTRLDLVGNIITSNTQFIKIYQDVMNNVPQTMNLKTFVYSPDTIHLEGSISTIDPINTFITTLRNYPGVDNVSLDKVENKTSAGLINIAITITFKQGLIKTL